MAGYDPSLDPNNLPPPTQGGNGWIQPGTPGTGSAPIPQASPYYSPQGQAQQSQLGGYANGSYGNSAVGYNAPPPPQQGPPPGQFDARPNAGAGQAYSTNNVVNYAQSVNDPVNAGQPSGVRPDMSPSATGWGNHDSANKPWLSDIDAAKQTRDNFYYGGTAHGAQQFNDRIGLASQGEQNNFNDVRNAANAGQVSAASGAANSSYLAGAANARDPGRFLSQPDMANNNTDRGSQVGAINGLNGFLAAGPGPSAAQAQLNMATDANMGNALALARSGRGLGQSQSALRQAIGQNAQTQQQSANQSAVLRAQEDQNWKANQLNAYGQIGGIAANARQGDLGAASYATGSQQASANANDAASEAYNQQQMGYGQLGLGYGNLGLGSATGGANAEQGAFGLQNSVNNSQLQGNANYEQNVYDYYTRLPDQRSTPSGGTDYSPYLAAGGAIVGAAFGGPGGAAAGGTVGGAAGKAIR